MASRPRLTGLRTYEDFQPLSNLLQEEECETLIVDLPGFRKDQIRVQMDDRSGTVMIGGERPMGNNRWNRFRKELRVPNNCNTSDIQAKFENGVLRVMMPVKPEYRKQEQYIAKPDQKPKPTPMPTPTPTPPPPPTTRKPDIQPRPPTAPKLVTELKPATPISSLPQSGKPVTETKNTQILTPPPPPQPSRPKPMPVPKTEMNEKLTSILAPLHPLRPNVPTESKPVPIPEQVPLSPDDDASTRNERIEKHIDLKSGEPEDDTKKILKEKERFDEYVDDGKYVASTSKRPKQAKEVKDAEEVKDEIKESLSHGVEGHKQQGYKGVAMDEESKQSIVNMVAAVLVVIALWLYIKYTIKTPW